MTIFIYMIKIFIVYYMDQAIQFIDNDNNKIIYILYTSIQINILVL